MKAEKKTGFPYGAILIVSFIAMIISFYLSPFLLAVSTIVFIIISVAFACHLYNKLPDDGWGPYGVI